MSGSGKKAELFAVNYLENKGYVVIERNWNNRFGEIDIIAKKNDTLHFIEVKYRKSSSSGGAVEYLTPKKLSQVRFTAKMWLKENNWNGPVQLDGIAITGQLSEKNLSHYLNI